MTTFAVYYAMGGGGREEEKIVVVHALKSIPILSTTSKQSNTAADECYATEIFFFHTSLETITSPYDSFHTKDTERWAFDDAGGLILSFRWKVSKEKQQFASRWILSD